jgi:hypothetical protein
LSFHLPRQDEVESHTYPNSTLVENVKKVENQPTLLYIHCPVVHELFLHALFKKMYNLLQNLLRTVSGSTKLGINIVTGKKINIPEAILPTKL